MESEQWQSNIETSVIPTKHTECEMQMLPAAVQSSQRISSSSISASQKAAVTNSTHQTLSTGLREPSHTMIPGEMSALPQLLLTLNLLHAKGGGGRAQG